MRPWNGAEHIFAKFPIQLYLQLIITHLDGSRTTFTPSKQDGNPVKKRLRDSNETSVKSSSPSNLDGSPTCKIRRNDVIGASVTHRDRDGIQIIEESSKIDGIAGIHVPKLAANNQQMSHNKSMAQPLSCPCIGCIPFALLDAHDKSIISVFGVSTLIQLYHIA